MLIAFDTETELIGDRTGLEKVGSSYRPWKGSTRGSKAILTSPWVCPPGIVLSWAFEDGRRGYYMIGKRGSSQWNHARVTVLDSLREHHVIFHNATFDVGVLSETLDIPLSAFYDAVADGRLHDTVQLDQLVSLSQGVYDYQGPVPPERMVPRGLANIAAKRLGLDVSKENAVRLTFAQFKDADSLPEDWAKYSIYDAVVTLDIYRRLRDMAPGTDLSESYQVKASLVVDWINRKGIRIDTAEARRLRDIFAKDIDPLEWKLVEEGYGEWAPRAGESQAVESHDIQKGAEPPQAIPQWTRAPGSSLVHKRRVSKRRYREWSAPAAFKIRQAAIRTELQRIVDANERLDPPRTPQGELSLDGDWWKDHLPGGSSLLTWCAYSRLRKVLSGYLELYSQAERVFPRWTIMVRSGRMSCSSPNVQNIPKRKYGLRSLFVPDPGHVFVVADYSMQELVTLADVMASMGIVGPLFHGLSGDLHKQTARLLKGAAPDAEVTKQERQGAKAVNFGCPGGLGPAKLRDYAENEYGVKWTLDEAKGMWRKYRAAYPDVVEYMKKIQGSLTMRITQALGKRSFGEALEFLGLGSDATPWDVLATLRGSSDRHARMVAEKIEHSYEARLPTGRVRTRCCFTEAANSYFQGTAADVTKEAAFLALRRGLDVRLLVHDEIVVQAREGEGALAQAKLVDAMLEAFRTVCPRSGHLARVEADVRDKWGDAKDGEGRTI